MSLEEIQEQNNPTNDDYNQTQTEESTEDISSYADDQDVQSSDLITNTQKSSSVIKGSHLMTNRIESEDYHQELYDEILEKLDIKKKDNNQEIQEKSHKEKFVNDNSKENESLKLFKNIERLQAEKEVEKAISQDFIKIQKLIKEGLISSAQGQNLKKQVLKKAFDKLVQTEKVKRSLLAQNFQNINQSDQISNNKSDVFDEFSKNNPNFFDSNGRKEVLNYLKLGNVNLGRDELNNISNIIRTVEKAAIDKYLQKMAHEKTLRNSNETAKQRLTANAQKSVYSGNLSSTFTREQIGKMSSAEFAKYESAIMEQLKKGHIR